MTPEVYDHIASSPAITTHVVAGSIGIVSGAVALFSRKGASVHRATGTVFFIAMLTTAAMATYLAIPIPQRGNAVGGIFTCYLLATAWMTVRREEGRIGLFERGAPLVALGAAAALLTFGVQGVNSPTGLVDGAPAQASLVMGAVAALAAILDLKVILRGGISGASRIARHLWRMCFALFIATGSFFIGQQKVMPEFVRGSPILLVLAIAPLILMIFWLFRVRFTRAFKPVPAPS